MSRHDALRDPSPRLQMAKTAAIFESRVEVLPAACANDIISVKCMKMLVDEVQETCLAPGSTLTKPNHKSLIGWVKDDLAPSRIRRQV